MPLTVNWPSSPALVRRLRDMHAAGKGDGLSAARVKGDVRLIVIEDNTEKLLGRGLLEGVDRYGKPLAPMAESTFKNPRRGFGPVLVPRGLQSRFITHFRATWAKTAEGVGVLVMGWADVVSKQGKSFVEFHLAGCPRGSNAKRPNWSLPQRDVAGISPAGWAKIVARHSKFAQDVVRGEK